MKLSIADVSTCLNLPATTIERWIRQGRIPMKKSGTAFFIQSDILQKWAADHNLLVTLPIPADRAPAVLPSQPDSLCTAMTRGGVFHQVEGDSVYHALKNAVAIIPDVTDEFRSFLLDKLIEREELHSTGIGRGVAIPHPRFPTSEFIDYSFITTCFLKTPVKFNAIDDLPVFVLFLLISPSTKHHLHLLSRLAYCVRDAEFVSFLKTVPDMDSLLTKITEFERKLDASG